MNLDPTDNIGSGDYGIDVATHEIGHTLGFPHEHQNPNAGIVWDEEAVYKALGGPPNNWSRETTFHNIIAQDPARPGAGLLVGPRLGHALPVRAGPDPPAREVPGRACSPPGGLSQRDGEWVHTFYPPLTPADDTELTLLEAKRLQITPGRAADFVLSRPSTATTRSGRSGPRTP